MPPHHKVMFKDETKHFQVVTATFSKASTAKKAVIDIQKKYPMYTDFRVFKVKK
jgi:hypothetical protein